MGQRANGRAAAPAAHALVVDEVVVRGGAHALAVVLAVERRRRVGGGVARSSLRRGRAGLAQLLGDALLGGRVLVGGGVLDLALRLLLCSPPLR
jgi:hypothetical protein